MLKEFEEEKSWDEKADEFEGEFVKQEDDDGNVTYIIRKPECRRRRKTISSSEDVKTVAGKEYPIDIWYLISEYIRPEDVGRFASICKTSFEVVCTAKFWFELYRKHYASTPTLPEELQPECLVRKYGLRTAVIRALHYMYPPFVNKLKSISIMVIEHHPDVLRNRLCEKMWYFNKEGRWCYCFKLRRKLDNTLQHSKPTDFRGPDLLEILDDVSANPDEHCRVLQITCKHFIHVPPVDGKLLNVSMVINVLSSCFDHFLIPALVKYNLDLYRIVDEHNSSGQRGVIFVFHSVYFILQIDL